MSIKTDFHWLRDVRAAGFDLVNCKSMEARDGLCWTATLTHGRTRIVTVGNSGDGHPDWLDVCSDGRTLRTTLNDLMDSFRRLPPVIEHARQIRLECLEWDRKFDKVDDCQYLACQTEISENALDLSGAELCAAIGHFAHLLIFEKAVKRACKTKVCVVTQDSDLANKYFVHKVADSPVAREVIQAHYKEKFSYFLADLLIGKI